MKRYKLKIGDNRYAIGGSGGDTTGIPDGAKLWSGIGHVKSHVSGVVRADARNREYAERTLRLKPGRAHDYSTETLTIVVCDVVEVESRPL